VTPRLLKKVSNADGISLWEQAPSVTEVTSQQTARTMMRLLEEVTRSGTGSAAAQLKHPLGGKTGTTSDYTDAWFLGFSPSVTCGVWVGFDSRESLGEKETGARAALPIWMTFMKAAIQGKDDERFLGDAAPVPAVAKTDVAQAAGAGQGKPGAKPVVASAPSAPGKPAQPSGVVKPTPSVSAGAKAPVVSPSKAATPVPASPASPTKPVVKPALLPSAETGGVPRPKPQPKPALPQ